MRINFEDKSFVEIKQGSPGKIAIILGAKKKNNVLEMEINACELEIGQFVELINNLGVDFSKTKN